MAGTSWTDKPRVMALRQRWAPVEAAAVTIDGYRRHRSRRNATIVAHFGFLSIFPLLLVATTILGFVLQNRPRLRETIIDSALSQLPFVGETISSDPSRLQGSVVVLVLGLGGALWAGMKAFVALQDALDDVSEVPLDDRPNLVAGRLRALLGILIVGVSQVVTAGLTTVVGASGLFGLGKALLLVATVAVNVAVLAATFRWLCSAARPWRAVLPGAVIGGVLFSALQLIGTVVVGRAVANATPAYGSFATVIGLFTWFGLHSSVAMWCAELNQTLHPHRPPDAC
jgi:membrane protein